MNLLKVSTYIAVLLVLLQACKQEKSNEKQLETHSHTTGHTHYSAQDSVKSHKLIFPSKVPDRIIANMTQNPEKSFAVNWRTNQQIDTGVVQIAVATDGPEFRLNGVRTITATTEHFENKNIKQKEPLVKANYHSAIIDGLTPETKYAYRVGNGDNKDDRLWSEWFHFTTASNNPDKPFSFIYFGDAQNEVKSMWSRVIRESYQMFPKVDFMLHAGDLINDRDSNLEWGEWFYAGSFIHATVPSVMTPGNHEYRDDKLSVLWKPQFNLPKNGPSTDLETCYYIDYNDMRLISIDAISFESDAISREAQVAWLENLLANNPKKWTTIFMHYPILSVAQDRDDDNLINKKVLKPIIDKYKVDLVLQGHDHTYARGEVKNEPAGNNVLDEVGTIYAVSVSGPKMYESEGKDWMDRRGEYTQLFQIITVAHDTLKYEAYSTIGNLYDAFDLIKTDDGKKKIINRIPNSPMRLKDEFVKKNK